MKILLFLISTFVLQNMHAQLLPSQDILTNTYNLFSDTASGTSFLVQSGKEEFLVTAKHLFKSKLKSGDSTEIALNLGKQLRKFKARIFFHDNPSIDVAVLKLKNTIVNNATLPSYYFNQIFLGQECLFLGFPIFGLGTLTDKGKVPFVKKGLLSSFHQEADIDLYLLDGHNNAGFSGGPVIAAKNFNKDSVEIIGVISGYINEVKEIKLGVVGLNDPKFNENSGILIVYPSKYIIDIVRKVN